MLFGLIGVEAMFLAYNRSCISTLKKLPESINYAVLSETWSDIGTLKREVYSLF